MKDNVKSRRLGQRRMLLPLESSGPPLRVQAALLDAAKRNERAPQIIRHAAARRLPPEAIRPAAAS